MKKVALITGTTGQDGAYLAELLLAKGYVVLFWSDSGWVRFFSKEPAAKTSERRTTSSAAVKKRVRGPLLQASTPKALARCVFPVPGSV